MDSTRTTGGPSGEADSISGDGTPASLAWPDATPEPGDPRPEENPWAWADDDGREGQPSDTSAEHVTAVLVTFDAARWLPATLIALATLDRRPDRLIAIDNASVDVTRELLEQAHREGILDAVYSGQRSAGFGEAVKSALRQDRAADSIAPGRRDWDGAGGHSWLWLLHDDGAPAPDALYQLLKHVTEDRSIDITGPKLLLPKRRHGGQPLSEVGVSISGTGRRELQLDPGEIDQGQRDQPRPRLGVSTCGMLVRTAVWQDLDGLDPALPVFRDGVEFGWRAHLNGYRVLTTPQAELTHRQVGRAGLRPAGLTGRRPEKVDRVLGMVTVAGHAPGLLLPLVWLRLAWSCVLHTLGYLAGKVPGRALDEILALGSFVAHPGRIGDLRRRTASIDPAPGTDEVVQSLRPPWWGSLRVAGDAVAGAVAERYRSVAGSVDAASLDELTAEESSSVSEDRVQYAWLSPIVITIAGVLVASLVAAREVLGPGSLVGPALLPAASTLTEVWRSVGDPIVGAPGQSSPPWLALMALGSTVFAGRPEWFVTALICGVVPLALLASYPVIRRMINDRRVRWWAAVTYALLPVLLGGTNQGRLTLSVVAIGLPLLAMAARALVLRRVRTPEAWRGAWGAGVVLVVLLAFEPALIFFATLVGLIGVVVLRRTPRKAGRVVIALALPLVVLLPWWPSLITAPGRIFVGPDSLLEGAGPAPQVWRLLLGRGLGAGLPPFWLGAVVFGMVWLIGVLGLVRRVQRRAVLVGWVTALSGFGMGAFVSRLVVDVPPLGVEVRPWPGAFLLIGFAGLIFAGGVGIDGLAQQLGRRSFTWLQPLSAVAGLVMAAVSLGGAAWWVWAGAHGPIDRRDLETIPPYVLNALASPAQPRLLAIDLTDGTARYSVVADDQVRLGDADRGFTYGGSTRARAQAADLVGRLVAGTADSDISRQLRDLGIGYVWMRGGGEDARAQIDNTPGLGTASGSRDGTVWELEPPVTRATIRDPRALVNVEAGPFPSGPFPSSPFPSRSVPPGTEPRELLLGEPADPRWRAELIGATGERTVLAAADGGWQQAFRLPAAGGEVRVQLKSSARWLLLAQGLLVLVAAVLAAPGVRHPEVRDPTKTARRAATLSEVG